MTGGEKSRTGYAPLYLLLWVGSALFLPTGSALPPWSCSEDWQFQSILQLCSSQHEPLMGACLLVSPNESVGKLCTCARRRNEPSKWSNCLGPCWHKLNAACVPDPENVEVPHNPVAGLDLRVCPQGTEYQFVQNSHVCGIVAEKPVKDENLVCSTHDNVAPDKEMPDPTVEKPIGWDDNEDGAWEAPPVPSPKYKLWKKNNCQPPLPTPLVAAVLEGNHEEVLRLLGKTDAGSEAAVDPTKATEGNGFENALMIAAELGLPDIVEALLTNNKLQFVLNAVNPGLTWRPRPASLFMPTALTYAVAGWQESIKGHPVNHTIKAEADAMLTASDDDKPAERQRVRNAPSISESAVVDHAKVAAILLDAGASPFAGVTGAGPLGFALELGLHDAIKLMLDRVDCGQLQYASSAHNDVDERTQAGKLPHINLVHAAAGTFSNQGGLGQTMFRASHLFEKHYARFGKQLTMVFDAFRRCNIDPKTRVDEANGNDPSPYVPLAEATMRCDGVVTKVLLDAGADPFGTGVFGPLLHTAAQVGCSPVVVELLSRAWQIGGVGTMMRLVLEKDDMFKRVPLQVAKDETVRCYLKKAAFGVPPEDAKCKGAQEMVAVLQDMTRGKRNLQADVAVPKVGEHGWRAFEGLPPMATDARPKCEIVEVDGAIESADFFIKYQSSSSPVIFRGARPSTWNLELWTPAYLKAIAGNESVSPKHIPYQFGAAGREMVLGEFIDELLQSPRPLNGTPPWYLFDNSILKTNKVLAENVKLPAMFANYMKERSRQLIIGSEGSGSPVHFHIGAVNVALFGRKRWFLYPPGGAFWARTPFKARTIPSLNWYLDDGPQLDGDMYECIQEPGDIMYVPNSMGHAVLNLEDSVAVAMEVMQTEDPRPKPSK